MANAENVINEGDESSSSWLFRINVSYYFSQWILFCLLISTNDSLKYFRPVIICWAMTANQLTKKTVNFFRNLLKFSHKSCITCDLTLLIFRIAVWPFFPLVYSVISCLVGSCLLCNAFCSHSPGTPFYMVSVLSPLCNPSSNISADFLHQFMNVMLMTDHCQEIWNSEWRRKERIIRTQDGSVCNSFFASAHFFEHV